MVQTIIWIISGSKRSCQEDLNYAFAKHDVDISIVEYCYKESVGNGTKYFIKVRGDKEDIETVFHDITCSNEELIFEGVPS